MRFPRDGIERELAELAGVASSRLRRPMALVRLGSIPSIDPPTGEAPMKKLDLSIDELRVESFETTKKEGK